MSQRRTHAPRSRVPKPLRTADGASSIIDMVSRDPLVAETICLLTDDAHLPLQCIIVEGGGSPDDVFTVAELVQELARGCPIAHVVLVSCRPGHGFEHADLDRWYELSAGFDEAGVELIDWFIRDESMMVAVTPLVGEVSRWPSR